MAKKYSKETILKDSQGYTIYRIHKNIHSTGFTRIYILQDSQGYTFYRIHKDIHFTGFTRIYILQEILRSTGSKRIHKELQDQQGATGSTRILNDLQYLQDP